MSVSALRKRPAWEALERHYRKIEGAHLRQLFAEDQKRGKRLAVEAAGIYFDYSKNRNPASKTADVVENTQGQLLSIAGGQPRTDNGAYGVYINFLQKLTPGSTANPDQGVTAFLNATLADRRTATVDSQIALGIFDTGPFDNRPKDTLGLAFGLTHVNGRFATAQELQNAAGLGPVGIQHTEYVGEVYYRIYAGNGIKLYPDLQYIRDPGGVSKSKDVIILGLKVNVSL